MLVCIVVDGHCGILQGQTRAGPAERLIRGTLGEIKAVKSSPGRFVNVVGKGESATRCGRAARNRSDRRRRRACRADFIDRRTHSGLGRKTLARESPSWQAVERIEVRSDISLRTIQDVKKNGLVFRQAHSCAQFFAMTRPELPIIARADRRQFGGGISSRTRLLS